jgi:hypothetical protein
VIGASQGQSTVNGCDLASSTAAAAAAAELVGNFDGWSAGLGERLAVPLSAGGDGRGGLTTVTSAGSLRTQWDISILNGRGASGAADEDDNIGR